ncbi:MAG: hypothetical protein KDC10_11515 [Calditrichaeota bacterium]|nr:hypothetical protein [Calditrichota bacterium]
MPEVTQVTLHFALDRYGAECLGRFHELDQGAALENHHHLFVWAGGSTPPTNATYWESGYPEWCGALSTGCELDSLGKGLEFDRKKLAGQFAEFLHRPEGRKRLDELINDWPRANVSSQLPYRVKIVLCGSLAEPQSSALILGWLSARNSYLETGTFQHALNECVVVAGCGLESGPEWGVEEHGRALIARALLDLEQQAKGSDGSEQSVVLQEDSDAIETYTPVAPKYVCPVYLVGEAPLDDQRESDRATQVALGAMSLLGICRCGRTSGDRTTASPFESSTSEEQHRIIGGRRLTGSTCFQAVGGYAVHVPTIRLAELVSAWTCRENFGALQKQESYQSLADCIRITLPESISPIIDQARQDALGLLWKRVAEKSDLSWTGTAQASPCDWYDMAKIQQLFEPIFQDRHWERLLDAYGGKRMRNIPLGDWDGALEDLCQVVEEGLLPRRRRHLAAVSRHVLHSLIESLDLGVNQIMAQAMFAPLHHKPHLSVFAFLGNVYNEILVQKAELHTQGILSSPTADTTSDAKERLSQLREELNASLAAVPSPAAVFLRILPVFSAPVLMLLTLPFELGILDSIGLRFGIGCVLGIIAVAIFFVLQVESVRRKLNASYENWLAGYRRLLDVHDEALRRSTFKDLLDHMEKVLVWYFNGKEDSPPMPNPYPINLKDGPPVANDAPENVDHLTTQQALCQKFPDHLTEASHRYSELFGILTRTFQRSAVETCLPEISPKHVDLLHREIQQFSKTSDELASVSMAEIVLNQAMEWAVQSNNPALLPYRHIGNSVYMAISPWRYSYQLPAGEKLVDPRYRDISSGFACFTAIKDYALTRIAHPRALVERYRQYLAASEIQQIGMTPLGMRFGTMSKPSVQAEGGEMMYDCIASGPDDLLALNDTHGNFCNSQGAGTLTVLLQVRTQLGAEQIIFHPNAEEPSTALGKSWLRYRDSQVSYPALESVSIKRSNDA